MTPKLVHDVALDPYPDEEETIPGPAQRMTVTELLDAVNYLRDEVGVLSKAVGSLVVLIRTCAIGAGAMALLGLLLWWLSK